MNFPTGFALTLLGALYFQPVMAKWEKYPIPNFLNSAISTLKGCEETTLFGSMNKNKLIIWNLDKKELQSFEVKSVATYKNQVQNKEIANFEFSANGEFLAITYLYPQALEHEVNIYSTATWNVVKTINATLKNNGFTRPGKYFWIFTKSMLKIFDSQDFNAAPVIIENVLTYNFLAQEIGQNTFKEKIVYRTTSTANIYFLSSQESHELEDPLIQLSPTGRFVIQSKHTLGIDSIYTLTDLSQKLKPITLSTIDLKLFIKFSNNDRQYAWMNKNKKVLTLYEISDESIDEQIKIQDIDSDNINFGFSPSSKFFWIHYTKTNALLLTGRSTEIFKNVIDFDFYMHDNALIIKNKKNKIKMFTYVK